MSVDDFILSQLGGQWGVKGPAGHTGARVVVKRKRSGSAGDAILGATIKDYGNGLEFYGINKLFASFDQCPACEKGDSVNNCEYCGFNY